MPGRHWETLKEISGAWEGGNMGKHKWGARRKHLDGSWTRHGPEVTRLMVASVDVDDMENWRDDIHLVSGASTFTPFVRQIEVWLQSKTDRNLPIEHHNTSKDILVSLIQLWKFNWGHYHPKQGSNIEINPNQAPHSFPHHLFPSAYSGQGSTPHLESQWSVRWVAPSGLYPVKARSRPSALPSPGGMVPGRPSSNRSYGHLRLSDPPIWLKKTWTIYLTLELEYLEWLLYSWDDVEWPSNNNAKTTWDVLLLLIFSCHLGNKLPTMISSHQWVNQVGIPLRIWDVE